MLNEIRLFCLPIFLFLLIHFFPGDLNAQNTQVVDSTELSIRPGYIVKSLLLPGWGQLNQERLPEATLFYFSTATFYYRTFFHFYHYKRTNSQGHLNLMQTNLSISLFFHTLNLIDVTDVTIRTKPKGWQGGLLADKPLKSPWGAALRSAIFPGWGQLYVKTYWKAAGYLLADGYLLFKAHEAELNYLSTGDSSYKNERSKYRWYFGLAYLITIADAYAGAHLHQFDKAMQMTLSPVIMKDRLEMGISVRF